MACITTNNNSNNSKHTTTKKITHCKRKYNDEIKYTFDIITLFLPESDLRVEPYTHSFGVYVRACLKRSFIVVLLLISSTYCLRIFGFTRIALILPNAQPTMNIFSIVCTRRVRKLLEKTLHLLCK